MWVFPVNLGYMTEKKRRIVQQAVQQALKAQVITVPPPPDDDYVPGRIYDFTELDKDGNTVVIQRRRSPRGGWFRVPVKGEKYNAGGGRPKRIPELEILLAEIMTAEENGVSAAMLILAALRKKAIAGDTRAAELLLDRTWGKAKQEINVNKTERQFILIGTQKIEF